MQPDPGGGDRLAVDVILHVAAGEHAGHAGAGAVRACTGSRSSSMSSWPREQRWCSACGRSRRTRRRPAISFALAGLRCCAAPRAVTSPFPMSLMSSTSVFHSKEIFGLANALSCMIFDARSVSRRWTTRDVGGEAGQEDRFLHRRVAAADDRDRLAAEEVAVAGRAGRDAVADQRALRRQAEQPRRRRRSR